MNDFIYNHQKLEIILKVVLRVHRLNNLENNTTIIMVKYIQI